MDTDFWEEVSYVQSSKNRYRVLDILVDAGRPMTPTELGEDMGIVVKSSSRAVRQLDGRGLVECVNPEAPRDRRYRPTAKGREVWAGIERIEVELEAGNGEVEAGELRLEYRVGTPEELEDDVSYLRISSNRKAVMRTLAGSEVPLTPTEMAEEIGTGFNSVSRAVRQLAERSLARCVNPGSKKFRRYELTGRGEEIYHALTGD